jgi:hypothetical protein
MHPVHSHAQLPRIIQHKIGYDTGYTLLESVLMCTCIDQIDARKAGQPSSCEVCEAPLFSSALDNGYYLLPSDAFPSHSKQLIINAVTAARVPQAGVAGRQQHLHAPGLPMSAGPGSQCSGAQPVQEALTPPAVTNALTVQLQPTG